MVGVEPVVSVVALGVVVVAPPADVDVVLDSTVVVGSLPFPADVVVLAEVAPPVVVTGELAVVVAPWAVVDVPDPVVVVGPPLATVVVTSGVGDAVPTLKKTACGAPMAVPGAVPVAA